MHGPEITLKVQARPEDKKDFTVTTVRCLRLMEKMGLPKKERLRAICVVRRQSLVPFLTMTQLTFNFPHLLHHRRVCPCVYLLLSIFIETMCELHSLSFTSSTLLFKKQGELLPISNLSMQLAKFR